MAEDDVGSLRDYRLFKITEIKEWDRGRIERGIDEPKGLYRVHAI